MDNMELKKDNQSVNNMKLELHWILKIILIAITWIGIYTFFELIIKHFIKHHTDRKFITKILLYAFVGIAAAILLYNTGHISCLISL